MDKIRRIITVLILVSFAVNSAGQGYALRPMAARESTLTQLDSDLKPPQEVNLPISSDHIDLFVTARCNLKCPKCYNQYRNSDEPTLAAIEEFASAIKDLGISIITITGGEPLLRDDIAEVLSVFYQMGIKINLSTNGMLLMEKWPAIAPYVSMLSISLDSSTSSADVEATGSAQHYNSVMEFLEFAEANNISPRIKIGTCLNRQNVEDAVRIGSLLTKYKCVDIWRLYQYVPLGIGAANMNQLAINDRQYAATIAMLKERFGSRMPISHSNRQDYEKSYMLVNPKLEVFMADGKGFTVIGKFNGTNLRELLRAGQNIITPSASRKGYLANIATHKHPAPGKNRAVLANIACAA